DFQSIQVGAQHLQAQFVYVLTDFFHVIGARPLYGALFRDSTATARHEVVISDRLWERLGDPHRPFAPFTLAVQYALAGETFTVIGVLPENGAPPLGADVFMPNSGGAGGDLLFRLRPGITRQQALDELNARAPALDPFHSPRAHFVLSPAIVSPAQHLDLVAALAACTLAILLVACANIASLLLARGLARRQELATRLAFGASRLQVARLLFVESGVVAIAGGILGGLLSLWTIHAVRAALPVNLQYQGLVQPQLSWRVLAAGVGLTVVAAVAFGVAPAAVLLRGDVHALMKHGDRRTTVGGARFRLLVVLEVAGALTLVVAGSLLGAVVGRVELVHYGYDASHLLRATVQEVTPDSHGHLDYNRPPSAAVIARRYAEMQSLRAMPGVAGVTEEWPWFVGGALRIDDPDGGEPLSRVEASRVITVEPSYLRVLGIKVLRGRDFHASEDDLLPSVIINQYAAHWLWPGADPLGRLIQFSPRLPWMRVVGIVGQPIYGVTCVEGPCAEPLFLIATGTAYPGRFFETQFVVRTTGDPKAFAGRLQRKLATDYPNTAPFIETWDQVTGFAPLASLYDFVGALVGAFAFIGLLLALIGVYGMAAYAVEQRAREFGIRIALGAQARDIIRIVLRDGNATALLGLALGLVFANWAEGLLAHYLFGYDGLAPYFMAGAMVALFAATVLAGIPPALRAARVDPVDTLRSE
ncbi:MAG: ABC transporter permease, partial [Gemmatimonadota bacterium]|nr:ABC transporter permease [Gemmatimonadota bacterium]